MNRNALSAPGRRQPSLRAPELCLIAAGTLALAGLSHADGLLRAWGSNAFNQITQPQPIQLYRSISAGYNHVVALRPDGSVTCWGRNHLLQCKVPPDLGVAIAVSAGGDHTLALLQNGTVRAWGNNQDGQSTVPADLGPCQAVSGGRYHSVALRTDGQVRCWGSGVPNSSGGTTGSGQSAVPADLGPCVAISGAALNTYVITEGGWFRGWGSSTGNVNEAPGDLGTITQVDGGNRHIIALRGDGTVRCWGYWSEPALLVPGDLGPCIRIAAGHEHCIALQANGTVRAWGKNTSGQASVPGRAYSVDLIDGGSTFSIAQLIYDCNGDGIADADQLVGVDCNGNLVPDSCDASQGFDEDCDGNGVADLCQSELSTSLLSPVMSPVGWGSQHTWAIPSIPAAAQDVALSIQGRGDFAGMLEYVQVRIGTTFSVNMLAGTIDCSTGVPWTTVTVPYEAFNDAIAPSGTLTVSVEPAIAVDPDLCSSATWVQLRLAYPTLLSTDCNGNGVLDTCEISAGLGQDANDNGVLDDCESVQLNCPSDLNGNGAVDGGDLGFLLSAWGGPTATEADLNGDGQVDGQDLGVLLGAWGACE